MRLNRVLLLAAAVSMAMAAMVFTISCSGDDGKDGASCTTERYSDNTEAGGGYIIKCGGAEAGRLPFVGVQGPQGEPGLNGTNCLFVSRSGTSATFDCDGTTVVIGGGSGGGGGAGCSVGPEDIYNDNEIVIRCPGEETLRLCHGNAFNKDVSVCHNGEERVRDTKLAIYNAGSGGDVLPLYDADDKAIYTCGGTQYNPNEHFCYGTTLTPLCGKNDFNESNDFCFHSGSYDVVLALCATRPFLNTQFCPVTISSVSADGTPTKTTYSRGSGSIPTLCGGKSYSGRIERTAGKEIAAVSLTGGEFYESDSEFGFALALPTLYSQGTDKYYAYGSSFCRGNKVVTMCRKTATSTSLQQDTLFYDPATEFCRDKTADSLEIVPICRKTGTTTGGLLYDKNFTCDPATGVPSKSCNGELYDETEYFCYGGTTKTKYCKDNRTSYNPAQAFCSYGGSIKNNSAYNATAKSQEVPRNKCAGKTLNVNGWNWEYCIEAGSTPATTVMDVLSCGVNEQPLGSGDASPDPVAASNATFKCECVAGSVRSLITKKCIAQSACPVKDGTSDPLVDETNDAVCGICPSDKPLYDAASNSCKTLTPEPGKVYNIWTRKFYNYTAGSPTAAQRTAACGTDGTIDQMTGLCVCPTGAVVNPWSETPTCVSITTSVTLATVCGEDATVDDDDDYTAGQNVCACSTEAGLINGKCE